MHLNHRIALTTGFITATVTALSLSAEARPHPDQLGICYFFRGDTQEQVEPCVLSSGYGTGVHYVIMNWLDGVKTTIVMSPRCEPGQEIDDIGFCNYTVDDFAAEPYERGVYLAPTDVDDPDNFPCFRVIDTGNSVCYRFNE